ncbi:mannitol 1-phosphate dehydrogenase [Polyplosphaeria fusca]|uniref:Mannitol 1-phosphate dehydrogenase n=1 Tax=Polyplosphaeria fusca TaxID=682080 RepID=A0A9P4QQH0_9PLEO|nr:mannitol 1-phosphate dehydrogenase [Polyplosphaeria fusca]
MAPARYANHAAHPIAIVGGGLGGLALAIGLLKHGVNIHIYEAAAEFSEIGAGVAFALNSTRALGLIDQRLLDGYKKHATYNEDPAMSAIFAQYRWGVDEKKEGGKKTGELMFNLEDIWDPEAAPKLGVRTRSCIHRARLLDELVALIPKGITSFGKSFEAAEERDDGTILLRFADGTTAMASALIGCDGVKSKARDIVFGHGVQATYTSEYAFRAMAPRAEIEAALGSELAFNGQLYCGYGAYIVTYPVERGTFTNMVAIPLEPNQSAEWTHGEWTAPATRQEFLEVYRGWKPELVELFARYCQPLKWGIFHLQHEESYYKGRICLLGDSAHATSPHLGVGAGMAMEDAYVLSNLIAAVSGPADIVHAFRAYDAVRRPRTQKLIKCSKLHGMAADFALEGVGDDLAKLKATAEECFHLAWHEDLEAELEDAKKLL